MYHVQVSIVTTLNGVGSTSMKIPVSVISNLGVILGYCVDHRYYLLSLLHSEK